MDEMTAIAQQTAATRYAGQAVLCFTLGIFPGIVRGPSLAGVVAVGMDALDRLRARIAGFPGYDADADRRLSDELVRSYLGEALAELAAGNAALGTPLRERIDALLLRVGFASQRLFPSHADGLAKHGGETAVADADREIVELADRAAALPPDGVAEYLGGVNDALDRRDAVMRAAARRA